MQLHAVVLHTGTTALVQNMHSRKLGLARQNDTAVHNLKEFESLNFIRQRSLNRSNQLDDSAYKRANYRLERALCLSNLCHDTHVPRQVESCSVFGTPHGHDSVL